MNDTILTSDTPALDVFAPSVASKADDNSSKNTGTSTDVSTDGVESISELISSECNESDVGVDTSMEYENNDNDSDDTRKNPAAPIKVFKSFDERIAELQNFKSQHGHCRVPSKFESNPSMGAWCANLKQSYRLLQEGKKPILKLTQDKLDALNDVGFEWKYSGRLPRRSNSDFQLSEQNSPEQTDPDVGINTSPSPMVNSSFLLEDAERDDESQKEVIKPPSTPDKNTESSAEENNTILGSKTRASKRIAETSETNPPSKRTKRERTKAKTFDSRIQELQEYKAKYGHCRVSRNDSTYYSLGSWCHNMRVAHRTSQKQDDPDIPSMSQEKIDALDAIGFDWDMKEPRQMKSFEERIEDLKEFKETHGHTRVPTGYAKNPSLAYWCNNVRNAFKMKNTGKKQYIALTQDRMDALDEIGFDFGKRQRKYHDQTAAEDESESITSATNTKRGQKREARIVDKTDTGESKEEDTPELVELEGGIGPIIFI